MGQQLRWPRRHGSYGDSRDRGRQRREVRWPVLPEPRGNRRGADRRGACRPRSRPPPRSSCSLVPPRPRCFFPFAVPWWLCRAGGPVAAPPGPAPAGGRAVPAAGSSARSGAPVVCGTGSVGGAPGPSGVERGVDAGTSGPVRWTGCGVLATVPPRLLGVRPQRGAVTPGGPSGLTCPQAGCWSAGRAPAAAPAPLR